MLMRPLSNGIAVVVGGVGVGGVGVGGVPWPRPWVRWSAAQPPRSRCRILAEARRCTLPRRPANWRRGMKLNNTCANMTRSLPYLFSRHQFL